MSNDSGGCLIVALVLLVGWALLIAVFGASDAIDSREVHPRHYQEVLDMGNEDTAELIRECMEDGKLTVAELNAIRKRFNETSGPQAELEKRYGE
jgi:hypothetical protein